MEKLRCYFLLGAVNYCFSKHLCFLVVGPVSDQVWTFLVPSWKKSDSQFLSISTAPLWIKEYSLFALLVHAEESWKLCFQRRVLLAAWLNWSVDSLSQQSVSGIRCSAWCEISSLFYPKQEPRGRAETVSQHVQSTSCFTLAESRWSSCCADAAFMLMHNRQQQMHLELLKL